MRSVYWVLNLVLVSVVVLVVFLAIYGHDRQREELFLKAVFAYEALGLEQWYEKHSSLPRSLEQVSKVHAHAWRVIPAGPDDHRKGDLVLSYDAEATWDGTELMLVAYYASKDNMMWGMTATRRFGSNLPSVALWKSEHPHALYYMVSREHSETTRSSP